MILLNSKIIEIAYDIVSKKSIKDCNFFKNIFGLKKINLTSGGSAFSQVSAIVEKAVQLLPPLCLQTPPGLPPRFTHNTSCAIEHIAPDTLALFNTCEFYMHLGRTLVYKTSIGQFIALKILKQNEDPEKLLYESAWFSYLNQLKASTIGLHGEYPLPLLFENQPAFKIRNSDLPESINYRIREIDILSLAYNDGYTIMAYQTDQSDYFTYYTEITDNAVAAEALAINIHDLFVLAKYGFIHPDLIVLFHDKKGNRAEHDLGKYLPFVNIIRDVHDCGAGSLKSWQKEVQYPNLRRSGLADFAEIVCLNDLISFEHTQSSYMKNNLQRFAIADQEKFLFMHFIMGVYPLSIILCEGSRLKSTKQLLPQNGDDLTKRLQLIYRSAFQSIVGKPDSIWNMVIDWQQAASQMIFFMGDAYKKYTELPLPQELYAVVHNKIIPGRGWGRIHGSIIEQVVEEELRETAFAEENVLSQVLNKYFYQEMETSEDGIFYFYDEQIAELFNQVRGALSKSLKKKISFQKDLIILKIITRLYKEYRTGWRYDGIWEDLGAINGPFPLTEIITAGYLYAFDILKELTA